ncbi:MAG: hypothetical protein B7Z22_05270 [Hyphomonas sp. 32-62-5]|nr:MAG: hypothetical protein B7Z22_05270 [Hyphomonas sp. 32-62-5]
MRLWPRASKAAARHEPGHQCHGWRRKGCRLRAADPARHPEPDPRHCPDRRRGIIGAPKARAVPLAEGISNGLKIALPALLLNLLAIPLYFIPGVNVVVFILMNAVLMGREYATLAASRHMSFRDAVALRNRHGFSVFLVGLACSVIPFFAPLVGAGAMVRLVHRLPRPDAAGRPNQ